ncbi:hypothetical protein K1719_035209 [Acacia pycnantha]|nr:hypothetical protein K1719_035209 [Acacia pycnantha]
MLCLLLQISVGLSLLVGVVNRSERESGAVNSKTSRSYIDSFSLWYIIILHCGASILLPIIHTVGVKQSTRVRYSKKE